MVQPAEHGLEHVASYLIEKDRDYYYAVPGSRGMSYVAPSTDAATVIRNSLVSLQSVNGGRLIIKGPTTYPIVTNIMPANPMTDISIMGVGNPLLQLTAGEARSILNKGTQATRCSVEGIIFDGNKTNQTDGGTRASALVSFESATGNDDIRIENCVIKNDRNGAGLGLRGNDIKIRHCSFLTNGVIGAAFPNDHVYLGAVTNGRISDCYFNDCTDTGTAVNNCGKILINNCNYVDANQQLIANDNQGASGPLHVTNCDLEQVNYPKQIINAAPFGFIDGGSELLFANCLFKNLQSGTTLNMFTADKVSKLALSNCQFKTTMTSASAACLDLSTSSGPSSQIMVNDCIFEMATGGVRGIVFRNTTNLMVRGNLFKTSDTGIRFVSTQSSKGDISGNYFEAITSPISYGTVPTTIRIRDNAGYNPVGQLTTPKVAGVNFMAPWGTSGAVVASTDYTVDGADCFFTSTGGTGVSITIKDGAGNTIETGLSTLTARLLPWGHKVNFGAFSVAPTITGFFL